MYECRKCQSENLRLEQKGTQTGLYCNECGTWQKWVSKDEKIKIERLLSTNNLNKLDDYYFEREFFALTINEIIPNLLDIMADYGDCIYTDDFHIFRNSDEFYIIHLPSGTMINWYKNLGRTNTCNKKLSEYEFKTFFNLLKFELMIMIDGVKNSINGVQTMQGVKNEKENN